MKFFILPLLLCVNVQAKTTLTSDNTIFLLGNIDWGMKEKVIAQYLNARLLTPDGPLYLVISSHGGQVEPANQMIDLLKADNDLNMVVLHAGSMAAALTQSLKGSVYMAPKSQLFFHEIKYYPDTGISEDIALDIYNIVKAQNKKMKIMCNAKMKLPKFEEVMKETLTLEADEAIKKHAATGMTDHVCDEVLKNWDIGVPVFAPLSGSPKLKNFCDLL